MVIKVSEQTYYGRKLFFKSFYSLFLRNVKKELNKIFELFGRPRHTDSDSKVPHKTSLLISGTKSQKSTHPPNNNNNIPVSQIHPLYFDSQPWYASNCAPASTDVRHMQDH